MRTAIYVYESTTLNIETNEDDLQLVRLGGGAGVRLKRSCAVPVDPGIYRIMSQQRVSVVGDKARVDFIANDKDKWPDPTPNALPAGYTSAAAIQDFFTVQDARGIANV